MLEDAAAVATIATAVLALLGLIVAVLRWLRDHFTYNSSEP